MYTITKKDNGSSGKLTHCLEIKHLPLSYLKLVSNVNSNSTRAQGMQRN